MRVMKQMGSMLRRSLMHFALVMNYCFHLTNQIYQYLAMVSITIGVFTTAIVKLVSTITTVLKPI